MGASKLSESRATLATLAYLAYATLLEILPSQCNRIRRILLKNPVLLALATDAWLAIEYVTDCLFR